MSLRVSFIALIGLSALFLSSCASKSGTSPTASGSVTLLNVSYYPTRELYRDYNAAFAAYWKKKTGQTAIVKQSHGGSGGQARAVINGEEADVVTLGVEPDVNAIQQAGLIQPGWLSKFPDDSSPYTSTIVLVVRQGNPKGIKDWPDLIKPGVQIVTPNPKTSGGARLNYLAAYGYALQANHGSASAARTFVTQLYHNVIKLDSGARGATQTFTKNAQGDVLMTWENEALLIQKQGHGQYQIVYPSVSILAEPPVAVVDSNVDKHGTRALATAYLQHLYSVEGQNLAAEHFYRPRDPRVAKQYAAQFPPIPMFTVSLFGGWAAAQKTHFADGGVFDQIYGRK
jgi:sulfate/thiosulfate-binding protein